MRIKKIVYCTPALYLEGGTERVLTLKANYFADYFGYDITIILTDGKGKPNAFPLSEKIHVINLDIDFEQLWSCSFFKKFFVYFHKQRIYKRKLTAELMRIRPDITISLLRREVNFLTNIKDGSKKVGELHVSKPNFRTFKDVDTNFVKELFSRYWVSMAIKSVKKLDKFVVLTKEDLTSWTELDNVVAIPNPISLKNDGVSGLTSNRVLAVGRYDYVKGYDLLLKAWQMVEKACPDWQLDIFGSGDKGPYERQARELGLDMSRCHLNGVAADISQEYLNSSLMVLSSRFEGMSMSVLEAMSFGLPVVAFECPCGPKDILSDGVGILVPKENVDKLAQGMISVMQSPGLARSLGKRAQARSMDFRMEKLAEVWRELFDSL